MLVVRIEIWPLGRPDRARELGRVEIVNDGSGDHDTGNYNVRVMHAASFQAKGRHGIWRRGRVLDHLRALSPYHLVMKALQNALPKERRPRRTRDESHVLDAK